jgi:hypothetical protein
MRASKVMTAELAVVQGTCAPVSKGLTRQDIFILALAKVKDLKLQIRELSPSVVNFLETMQNKLSDST